MWQLGKLLTDFILTEKKADCKVMHTFGDNFVKIFMHLGTNFSTK